MLLTTPVPFTDAANLLRGKLPVTRALFDAMLPELRAAAFVITGVEDLRAIERVRNIAAGIPEGEDWEVAKDRIIAELDPWLNDPDAAERRAELLLRSHAYAAYSTMNYRALEEQSDIFTWKKYQTAQDERVRGTHRALDGVIAPASSPFWRDHTPPWDFGCRCDVVGLTDDDVEELRRTGSQIRDEEGKPAIMIIEPGTPELEALEQGNLFRDQTMHFVARDPDHYIYDPAAPLITTAMLADMKKRVGPKAWAAFQDWARNAEVPGVGPVWNWMTRPPRKPRTSRKKTPQTAEQARKKLDALAPELAAADAEIDALLAAQYSTARDLFDNHPNFRTGIKGLPEAYAARELILDKARAALAVEPAAKRPFEPVTKAKKDKAILVQRQKEALDQWSRMLGSANMAEMNKRLPLRLVRNPDNRAYYDLKGAVHMTPGNSVSVHMHEIAHWLEDASPTLMQRSVDFLEKRTAGDSITYYNGSLNEPVKADQFWSVYCGKLYRKGGVGDFYATEILSMGIERYTFDPVAFAAADPDYFDFVYDTLRQPL